jgi:hypothetical protein
MAKVGRKSKTTTSNNKARACNKVVYLNLRSEEEIDEFKYAFPKMADFIGPDGKVFLPTDPSVRLRSLYAYHDKQAAEEYLIRMLNAFKMRGMTTDEIALLFDVSVPTIYRWNRKLKESFSAKSNKLDLQCLFGETLQYFDEMSQAALREADKTDKPKEKARLMETSMKAIDFKIKILEKAGLFKNSQIIFGNAEDYSEWEAEDIEEPELEEEFECKAAEGKDSASDELKEKYQYLFV